MASVCGISTDCGSLCGIILDGGEHASSLTTIQIEIVGSPVAIVAERSMDST